MGLSLPLAEVGYYEPWWMQILKAIVIFVVALQLVPVVLLVERKLLPAGQAYLAHVRRAVHNLTFEEHDKHAEEERKRLEALSGAGSTVEDDLGVGDEEETEDLLLLDPKEWKVRAIHVFCNRSS